MPGVRDARTRTFAAALFVAFVLHLPFTPLPFILRLLGAYLNRSDTSWDYQDDRVIIPISMFDEPQAEPPPVPEPPPAEPAPATPAPAEPKEAKKEPPPDRRRDAGVADATAGDGAIADARAAADAARRISRDSGAGDARTDGGGGSALKDTLSLAGGVRRAVQGKPNVELLVWFSTIRDHPLGPLVGGLLSCSSQWQDFLGDFLDPLKDLDSVMLVAPMLRDTSKMTAFAQHNLDEARANEVMSSLAKTAQKRGSGGSVPTGHPGMLAVRFHADRADRIAMTHPRNLIVITPPEGFQQLRDNPEPLSLAAAKGRAMSLTMVTPWRPARSLGLQLPDTLSEMRVQVSAAGNGADVEVEFDDKDAASATAHARDITEQVRAMAGLFLSDVTFVAQDNHITMQTHLSALLCSFVLGYARQQICPGGAFDGGRRGL